MEATTEKTATYTRQVDGEAAARALVDILVMSAQWFEVAPAPDRKWQVKVRIDNRRMLDLL
jgi:hypothetical protein